MIADHSARAASKEMRNFVSTSVVSIARPLIAGTFDAQRVREGFARRAPNRPQLRCLDVPYPARRAHRPRHVREQLLGRQGRCSYAALSNAFKRITAGCSATEKQALSESFTVAG